VLGAGFVLTLTVRGFLVHDVIVSAAMIYWVQSRAGVWTRPTRWNTYLVTNAAERHK